MANKNNLAGVPVKTVKFWRILGGQLVRRIRADAAAGIMQDGESNLNYAKAKGSQRPKDTYKARKARGMTKLNPQRGKEPGQKRYYSVAGLPTNRQTSHVNLKLTGRMLKSLYVKTARVTKKQTWLAFRDGTKVLANKAQGRNIHGLNSFNMDYVLKSVGNEHRRKIRRWARNRIDLRVGF